ncbi:lysophospholipase [Pseudomonas sp. LRF_L74]|uniref:alpha/beta hydrolase n=1 Tax=Pseudomonas sp. LRF_L74 TaxID=3369422 RepID=UPI003F63540C
MCHEAFSLAASDSTDLLVNRWYNDSAPRAVLMIVHGMAEHAVRYARFAEALLDAGLHVYAHDQRGHGRTAQQGILGHLADENGWAKVVEDLSSVNHHIRQQYPSAPILLFAHSMGSYVGMTYLLQHSSSVKGAILSGSNYQPTSLYQAALLIARFERWRLGPRGRSQLIDWLSFGNFNRALRPTRTAFDWLSRDRQEVDRFLADPLCGFSCTTQLWIDLLQGLRQITPPRHLAQIDASLPLLIVGGESDPVSQGERLADLANALRQAGLHRVELKRYPGARHELLNETNRDEVIQDLIAWMNEALATGTKRPTHDKEPT